jgi:DnaJ-class molecular chaperone
MESEVDCPRCKGQGRIPIGGLAVIRCITCDGMKRVSPDMRERWIEADTKKDEADGPAA